jgi:site-specific recombinase XerD
VIISAVKNWPMAVRLVNWLTAKQAQALLSGGATPTKGLRDRAILAVLLSCGRKRSEVAAN